MSQAFQLDLLKTELSKRLPPSVLETLNSGLKEFVTTFMEDAAIRIGDEFPLGALLYEHGIPVAIESLVTQGPVLLTFFRGSWCPYCCLALNELQEIIPKMQAADASIQVIAVSPQQPQFAKTIATQNVPSGLRVFTDESNSLAEQLGILWRLPLAFDESFKELGIDLHIQNELALDPLQVPIPASFYIDRGGLVKRSFLDPDFTKRLEPQDALRWVQEEAQV
ncbi:unnamed protein product [Sympodiomycopsis kandeliae]